MGFTGYAPGACMNSNLNFEHWYTTPLTPGATSACGRDCSRRRRSTTSGVTVTARPPRPTNAVCRRQRPDTESPVFSASSWSPFVSVGLLLDLKLTGRSREVTASVAMMSTNRARAEGNGGFWLDQNKAY